MRSAEQNDLRAYLRILWRWKILFVTIVVFIPVAAYTYTSSQPKVYESSVLMQVQQVTVDTSLFAEAPPPQAQVLASTARLITTTGVAQAAAHELREPRSNAGQILAGVSATADPSAGFVTIVAMAPTPRRAAEVANAFAAAVVLTRRDQAVKRLNATIGRISDQLDRLRRDDRDGRTQLSEQLQRLRALRAAQGSNATVVEPAVPSSTPTAPRVTRTVVLAGIIAILLASGAVVLAQGADRRIRNPLELEQITGGPLLSVIPVSAFADERMSAAGQEAFQTLRASITYFNIDQPIASVLISSPAQGDGKTTVATNLARAMARAGKDVILVDADLRRPRVAERLHVNQTAGLAAVLVKDIELEHALIHVSAGDDVAEPGRLRILPSGDPPPNPSALLASQRMRDLVDDLAGMSDLVIIDSTPLLVVSDSLPLVEFVSGIVAVARLNMTTRDAVKRFEQVIVNAGGTLLGTVASGATGADPYGYGYGGYTLPAEPPPTGGGRSLRRVLPAFMREHREKPPKNIEPTTREAP